MLMLVRDQDGDGLNAYEEDLHGTSDGDPNDPEALDFDGDGLTDLEEARPYRLPDDTLVETGWDVQVVGEDSYHVFSDPRAADADDDGLSDLDEKRGLDGLLPDDPNDAADATDPNKSDTDGDGIPDADDLAPTFPAPKLRVKLDATGADGLTWDTAYTELETAVAEAASRNSNSDPTDDVGEIWVAEGAYVPSEPLSLSSSLGLYGGFVGDETKRSQRNADPMTNNTVIRGHLFSGDSVISVISATGVEIDGFSISDCLLHPAVEIVSDPIDPDLMEITLRNLHFVDNVSGLSGGACAIAGLGSDGICNVGFERCVFSNNQVYDTNGGALAIMALADATVTVQLSECQFIDNGVDGDDYNGGAIACIDSALTLYECAFFGNRTTHGHGGAIASYDSDVNVDSCNFDSNLARRDGALLYVEGGAIRHEGGSLHVYNSRFARNEARNPAALPAYAHGGAVWVKDSSSLAIVNCVFWRNEVDCAGLSPYMQGSGLFLESVVNGCVTNCTLVENIGWDGAIHCESCVSMVLQNCIVAFNDGNDELSGGSFTVTHCCVYPGGYSGFPVLDVEPGFPEGWEDSGDLHLAAGSPCIDYGNSFVDTDLGEPGPQYLPLIDLDGNPRFFDGDDDGESQVDLGAYEYQGGGLGE